MASFFLNQLDWQFKGFVGEDWLLRKAYLPDTRDTRGWQRAAVPGSVQHDLWRAGMIPDPYQGMNSLAIEWVSDRTWVYRTQFDLPENLRGQQITLIFHGVDYSARYFLNGEAIGQSTGMFLPVRFDVTGKLRADGPNHLCVVIDPAPFEQPQIGYTSQVYTQKTRMNYWWDFCPRMVHQGIWQPVELYGSGPLRLADVFVQPVLAADYQSAHVTVSARVEGTPAGTLEVSISPEERPSESLRKTVYIDAGQETFEARFELNQPDLWWPNGAGEQPLYRTDLRIATEEGLSDQRTVLFGVRKIEFIANDGASEQALPYTLVVNGRRIYIQGWNWVPMDVLYGVDQPEKRERLLRLAQQAHVNLLRVWGGGLIEQQAFYDLCDRLGILIWQEFIQSSSGIDNFPSQDPDFIAFLTSNAQAAVVSRRNHPALAAWCGGNELHYAGDRLCDDSHPALAAMVETVRRLDPGRQWFPTSPSGGVFGFGIPDSPEAASRLQDVHGPWEYQGLRAQYQLYNQGQSMLHSEFGVEGLTNQPALDAVIPADQQWPVSLDNPLWFHLGSWWVKNAVWAEAWGDLPDVQAYQRATQYLQADGLRYAVEADRRRQYRNSGTMPWQFNEPYPMAACTSAVDYFAEPKPVYYLVARAYRPVTINAVFDTLAWQGEDNFHAAVWCSNTGAARAAQAEIRAAGPGGEIFASLRQVFELPEDGSREVAQFALPMAQISTPFFFLDLELLDEDGQEIAENRYLFSKSTNLAPLLKAQPAEVQADVRKNGAAWEITLSNPAQQAALNLWLAASKPDLRAVQFVYFSDNYFCLLPGEQRTITADWSGPEAGRALLLSGWNIAGARLE